MTTKTKLTLTDEQVAILRSMTESGSHTFYTEEFTRRIEAAFSVKVGYTERANTRDPKGLTVEGVGRNAKVYGSSSHTVACAIADKLAVPYERKLGRGSQYVAAMSAIQSAAGLNFHESNA